MTTTTVPQRSTVPASRTSTTSGRKRPRWLFPLIVAGLLVGVSLAVTVLTPDSQGTNDDLDPANPGSLGAQALARVLGQHGVTVTVARTQRQLLDATVDGATTVVVTRTDRLSAGTARTALNHASSAASMVLLDPDSEVTKGMALPVDSHVANLVDVTAGCRGAVVGAGFRLAQAGRAYTPTGRPTDATSCFPDKSDGGAALVRLPAATGRPPVTLLGDTSLITNGAILDADNAAIALRLFGQSDRLIWYAPSLADITAADSASRSTTPPWFEPGVILLASAVVLLCLWRGRRLGPLVAEPLPVIVRAVETTESRGRMYRKSRDRVRALTVLQLATRRRLASYLGLPPTSPVSSVAAAAAAVSGRNYQDVLDLLSLTTARDDPSLLKLANTLVALEKEVRRT